MSQNLSCRYNAGAALLACDKHAGAIPPMIHFFHGS
jgi:hypothetical protein